VRMKEETKELLLNYLMLMGVVLVLLAGIFTALYYFSYKKNECIANPLTYGAKQLTEEIGHEFIGSGFFLTPINIRSPRVAFNSTNLWIAD